MILATPMTESEWLASRDPLGLIIDVWWNHPAPSARKSQLFVCECARRVWDVLPEPARRAVEVAERFADSEATGQEAHAAYSKARELHNAVYDSPIHWAYNIAAIAAYPAEKRASDFKAVISLHHLGCDRSGTRLAHTVRCIFGN